MKVMDAYDIIPAFKDFVVFIIYLMFQKWKLITTLPKIVFQMLIWNDHLNDSLKRFSHFTKAAQRAKE